MHLTLASAHVPLLQTVAGHLRHIGQRFDIVANTEPNLFSRLRLPVDTAVEAAAALLTTLAPLSLALSFEPGRTNDVLEFAPPRIPDHLQMRVVTQDPAGCQALVKTLQDLGFRIVVRQVPAERTRALQHCSVSPDLLALVAWAARLDGWEVTPIAQDCQGRTLLTLILPRTRQVAGSLAQTLQPQQDQVRLRGDDAVADRELELTDEQEGP